MKLQHNIIYMFFKQTSDMLPTKLLKPLSPLDNNNPSPSSILTVLNIRLVVNNMLLLLTTHWYWRWNPPQTPPLPS